MKKLIVEIDDLYAGAVSITAIGVAQVGSHVETHVKANVVVLEGESTTVRIGNEREE